MEAQKRKMVNNPQRNKLYFTHNGTAVKYLKEMEGFGGHLVRVVSLAKQGLPNEDTDIIIYSLWDAMPPQDFISSHNHW